MLEPLWWTLSYVHELVNQNQELGDESSGLEDTLQLVNNAVTPIENNIKQYKHNQEVLSVIESIRKISDEATTVLKNYNQRNNKFFGKFSMRPGKELDDMKGYQVKLNQLLPILSLALANTNEIISETNNLSNKLLTNPKAKEFWQTHFGDAQYDVDWERFKAAALHEFDGTKCAEVFDYSVSRKKMRTLLTGNNADGKVTIYNYAEFTKAADLPARLKILVDELTPSERSLRSSTDDMPPPISPILKVPSDCGAILTMVGLKNCTNSRSKKVKTLSIKRDGNLDIERILYQNELPRDIVVRISRVHCKLYYKDDLLHIRDNSGNGTYINGVKLGKGNETILNNGDMIGLLMDPRKKNIELGYKLIIKSRKRNRKESIDIPSIYVSPPEKKKRKKETF
eukprot:TRINITY_DN9465_c0_g1_i1.p1 TRINITY_DN9465_c0_g1~~TRINITY_DN9465_c0_g1_i1.p1  ORF type:complete len:398 (+),score=77.99 TRINITY_DN9465_c0_g1_i1:22-1215(+)